MQYSSNSIRPCFYHQSHPQLGIVFALAPSLHSFWSLSRVYLFVTPWTVARQAPLSIEFWNGLPFPPPGDLSDPGIEPRLPAFQADSLQSELPGKTQEKPSVVITHYIVSLRIMRRAGESY